MSDKFIPVVSEEPTDSEKVEFEQARDINRIHDWGHNTELGSHNVGHNSSEADLVMVLKADLLKKFPNLFVYAIPAFWTTDIDGNDICKPDFENSQPLLPSFFANMPGTILLGFDLSASDAHGSTELNDNDPGWFFVIEERVGDIRFGLDVGSFSYDLNNEWNNLSWENMGQDNGVGSGNGTANNPADINYIDINKKNIHPITLSSINPPWGKSASDMGRIFYQPGVRVSIHADDMIS